MVKKIKPVSRTVRIEAEINRIIGEVLSRDRDYPGLDESWVPYVDISEKNDEIILEVELPGVSHKDVNILLFSTKVDIRGIKKENVPQGQAQYVRLEREYGPFRRVIPLPSVVAPEKSEAVLENGILTLTIQKFTKKKAKEVILKIKEPKE